MISFRTILSEVAEPKADDEKHFKDKHIVVKKKHPAAPDHVFTGKIGKAPKRLADYDKGEDEFVYEGSFGVPTAEGGEYDEEESHKKYKKGNKSKDLRREEVEELDEISRDLARSYIRKASDQFHGEKNRLKLGDKAKKRSAGITMAGKKAYSIPSEPRVRATESVEQVDEISKKTLSSYTRKAASSMGTAAHDLGQKKAAACPMPRMRDIIPLLPPARDQMKKALGADHAPQSKDQNTIGKRLKGIDKATARLAKEESELEEKLVGGQKKLDHNKNGKIDAHDFHLMRKKKKMQQEEAEQLDELSPNTLHSYIKKAAGNMAGNAAVAAAQASSSMKKSSPDVKRKIKNRMQGITGASGRLADKANMAENAWEEVPMMMRQLQFIMFAAEELMDYLDTQVDPEEWFQNKLAHIHDQMQTLQAYAEGDMRMMSRMGGMYREEAEQIDEISKKTLGSYVKKASSDMASNAYNLGARDPLKKPGSWNKAFKRKAGIEKATDKLTKEETELDESITKMSHGRLKFHLNTNTPHGSYSNDEMKAERDRRLKAGEGQAYRAAKAGLSEVTRSAVKKTVTFTGSDGKSHTRNVPVKRIDRDEHGQEKIRESVELDEAFKVGMLKLNDGGSVILKKEDVDVLNSLFKSLSSTNRKKMESTAMKDKNGFNEILSFAREAM